jgi:hypothetical protein
VAEEALAEGLPLAQPQVLYRRVQVSAFAHDRLGLDGGAALSGPLVAGHLGRATEVVVLMCTIGPDLEQRSDQAMAGELKRGLALDGVGSAAAEALGLAACEHFGALAQQQGLLTSVPIGPGMAGWPVAEGQAQIGNLLDPAEIGIRLLPTGLMYPRKSLSMVIGLGSQVATEGQVCDYCVMRDRCRYRSRRGVE